MEYFHNGTLIKNHNGFAIYSKVIDGNNLYCAVIPATYSCTALRASSYMLTVGDVESWIDG